MGKHMEAALKQSADMLLARLREEAARAEAAEAKLRAVGELPRYNVFPGYAVGTVGDCRAPNGRYIKTHELEALLKGDT